jgi:nucleotidyltransferase/DNA polymerase involved in DNA repair
MRIGCVLIQSLAVQLALSVDPGMRGQPVVIGGLPFEAKPVHDASPEAAASGVKLGMPLHEAHTLCPEARFLPCDDKKCEEIFEKVVDILERFSPLVEVEKPGCAYLDVSGIQSELSLAQEVLAAISGTGLRAHLGISSGRFFSWAAAFTSKPEVAVIVPPGEEKEFIAPFSIDFLPCSAETKERLQMLGIRFIGELSRFPREALAAQFGSEGILIYELTCGIDQTPLMPRKKPQVIAEGTELDPPATTDIEMLQSCQSLLDRLLPEVRAEGKACREVLVKVSFALGELWEKKLPLKEATSSKDIILNRIRVWLEGVKFPAPATEVRLSLWLTAETGKRLSLWPDNRLRPGLAAVANELKLRFNYQPLKKAEEVKPSPILPERRFRLIDTLE